MKTSKAEIENGLAGFTGTEEYHRINLLFPHFVLTDGAYWLAQKAECFWLFEAIASHQPKCQLDAKLRDMQFWTLTKHFSGSSQQTATLKCERDTGDKHPIVQEIPFTDFPLDEIKIWVAPTETEKGLVMVALLPSEY